MFRQFMNIVWIKKKQKKKIKLITQETETKSILQSLHNQIFDCIFRHINKKKFIHKHTISINVKPYIYVDDLSCSSFDYR